MIRRLYVGVFGILLLLGGLVPVAEALVSAYSFENGSGTTLIDYSGNGQTGTLSGTPVFTTDVPVNPIPQTGAVNNFSLLFDGINDVGHVPFMFPFHHPGDVTLEFWLKVSSTAHQSVFWTRPDSINTNRFNIFVNADNMLGFDYRSPVGVRHPLVGDSCCGAPIPRNTWTHVAITRSGKHYALYVNGRPVAAAIDAAPDLPTAVGWQMSGRAGFMYNGALDEVRIADQALTPSEFRFHGPSPLAVGGSVTGVNPTQVLCRNETTGQTVIIRDGGNSWNCEAAGLEVWPGDSIRQTVIGPAVESD